MEGKTFTPAEVAEKAPDAAYGESTLVRAYRPWALMKLLHKFHERFMKHHRYTKEEGNVPS